ncbi:hypothetical protein PILCRDRAFT_7436 [Piloderma croceum F 1598]|uniref:Uncharacterized protein n=1 Tax=Piloderma croceum (strain F 1598) TaxID=765440 RepID=A0A0C3FET8_PILCF|nr:hypothetical protein PILCRDRAFT_7436 [Piloderma croceum F 1598]
MFYASEGVTKVWDNFLQSNTQGRNGSFHAKDYYVVRAVSPYFMLYPTKLSTWFITWPGTAGKDNNSGMSRLITGTPLCLEDITVCTHTCALEFHVYHCVLGLPFLRQGSYTFITPTLTSLLMKPFPTLKTLSAPLSPSETITLSKQEMVLRYPNLARPPHRIWEYREEEEKELQEKFNWFTSSEDNIREEVANILKARESRLG